MGNPLCRYTVVTITAADAGSCRFQGFLTLLPIAGAELVRLQRIEHTQHLLRAAANVEIGDVHETDDALRVHDVRGPLRDACLRIQYAEAARELPLDVGEHGEGKVPQLILLPPPGEVHVLTVDADPEHLRVSGLELLLQPAECRDLGRADEGEVLRPEENDFPLAGKA